eukprot:7112496-Pyramimonas_sp.AAC.1
MLAASPQGNPDGGIAHRGKSLAWDQPSFIMGSEGAINAIHGARAEKAAEVAPANLASAEQRPFTQRYQCVSVQTDGFDKS